MNGGAWGDDWRITNGLVTVETIGAYKVVSRRGPMVAALIVQRRIDRFRRRVGAHPVTPVEIGCTPNMMTAEHAVHGRQRVVRLGGVSQGVT